MRARASILAAALFVALAAPRPARAQDNFTFARQRLERGVELYEAARYDAALEEFRASLTLYPSPNPRLYIARCLRQLGHLAEAVAAYERTVAEARERAALEPRYAPTRDAAASELAELEARVGRLVLTIVPAAPPGLRVRVAGRELPAAAVGLAMAVDPGAVPVAVSADGFAPAARSVTVGAGQHVEYTVRLAPPAAGAPSARLQQSRVDARAAGARGLPRAAAAPSTPAGVSSAPGWVALGLGGASLIAFGALYYASSQQYAGLVARCGADGPCGPGESPAIDTGEALQVATNVALGVGLGAVGFGAVWLIATRLAAGSRPAARAVTVAPLLRASGGGAVSVAGLAAGASF